VDKDGRNVLQYSLLFKQFDFLDDLDRFLDELAPMKDNKKQNVLHYVVLSKNVALMHDILYDEYFPNLPLPELLAGENAGLRCSILCCAVLGEDDGDATMLLS
jgi:hypothetical protein